MQSAAETDPVHTGSSRMATDNTTRHLEGKRILLTGGTTGIGRATLLALARNGARLLTFGRTQEPLNEVLELCGTAEVSGIIADASRPDDIERIFTSVDATLAGIDILVANAALGAGPIHEMADEDWRYVVETNLVGYLACSKGALERMRAQGSGHIVLISSISPEILAPGESVYAATKAGINAFALTLRKEVAEDGIKVSVIEPGSVGSDMQPCDSEEQRQAIARAEMLYAEEIADAVLFVLSRSERCDVSMMRVEPLRQKTS
jgi:NADP-dependent 3-hydroxy acid dehydrogenase YdfG